MVLVTFLVRFLASWFARHEEEANKVSERFFESPTSLQKVCVAVLLVLLTPSNNILYYYAGMHFSHVQHISTHLRLAQIPVPSIFSEATKSLTIVIPAYNEEARLPATLDETLRCNPAPKCQHTYLTSASVPQ